MALGTTAAILGLAGAGAGFGISKLMAGAASKVSAPAPLPQAPSVDAASDKAENIIKKKRASATQSIYTSPLGIAGEAQISRKTLLGQ